MNKKLSFWSIYFLGMNSIIGSGTFLLPQTIYKDMGVLGILVLVVSALSMGLIVTCYAKLASQYNESGGSWIYSYHAFGKFTGFQVGMFTYVLGCCGTACEIVAFLTTLTSYNKTFANPKMKLAVIISIILIFFVINYFGNSFVKVFDNISSATKVFVIIFFIVIGIFFMNKANFHPIIAKNISSGIDSFSNHFSEAFSVTFYMFGGFSLLPIAARKMKNAKRNLPKVLTVIMLSLIALYSLVMLVCIGILGHRLAFSHVPVADALLITIGKWGYLLIIVCMLIGMVGAAFAQSYDATVLPASLANEHHMLPQWVGKKNRFSSPVVSQVITYVIIFLLTSQSYLFLVSLVVLASFIQYVPSILAVFKLSHANKTNGKAKIFTGYVVPTLALLVSMYLIISFSHQALLIGAVVIVVNTLLYNGLKNHLSME
ncbi:APC family permease [uncultured Limosilactobacillus sp.]|uniref:APC family permease n=1 Tax=uncultured Limosilactobacillus sp. TaxID=2837629 RepID=UPI0025E212ED|nr:APC family permease [uncultured Limosilactobacillus sp.]